MQVTLTSATYWYFATFSKDPENDHLLHVVYTGILVRPLCLCNQLVSGTQLLLVQVTLTLDLHVVLSVYSEQSFYLKFYSSVNVECMFLVIGCLLSLVGAYIYSFFCRVLHTHTNICTCNLCFLLHCCIVQVLFVKMLLIRVILIYLCSFKNHATFFLAFVGIFYLVIRFLRHTSCVNVF